MMNLEDELRSALHRQDPPPGFGSRVMEQTKSARPYRRVWAPAAIAATVILAFASSALYQSRQQENAGRQTVLALRIAAEKLNAARGKVLAKENQ